MGIIRTCAFFCVLVVLTFSVPSRGGRLEISNNEIIQGSGSRSGKFPEEWGILSDPVQRKGKWPTLTGDPTIIVAHRGEKVFMPEHTVGSYELAAIEGAEFVEPDLALTKDGHLVCFHDLFLRKGTDVANLPQFAHLMKNFTGVIDEDGENVTMIDDWLVKDFTLAELKELSVVQKSIGVRPQYFNELFRIPTFQEYLNTVHRLAYKLKRSIGIIPELKHPMFHNQYINSSKNNNMENLVLSVLEENGYPVKAGQSPNCRSRLDGNASIPCGHLVLQCFELSAIKYLSNTTNIDRMMLIDRYLLHYLTFQGLRDLAPYITFYGPWKEFLYTGIEKFLSVQNIDYDRELIAELGGFVPPQEIVKSCHALGMMVGIYTIYDSREPSKRGCDIESCDPENKEVELYYYFEMGVDGMFVENVPEARELRQKYHYEVVLSTSDGHISEGWSFRPNLHFIFLSSLILQYCHSLINF